jgi:hypothetical protein
VRFWTPDLKRRRALALWLVEMPPPRGKNHSRGREDLPEEERCARENYSGISHILRQLRKCGFVQNDLRDPQSENEFLALLNRSTPITSEQKISYYTLRLLGGNGVGFANYCIRRNSPAFALWGDAKSVCHLLDIDVPLAFDHSNKVFFFEQTGGAATQDREPPRRGGKKKGNSRERRGGDKAAAPRDPHPVRMDKVWDNFRKSSPDPEGEVSTTATFTSFASFAAAASGSPVSAVPVAASAPEPVAAPVPEPVAAPAPEPVAAPVPEPVAAPAPEPVVELDPGPKTAEGPIPVDISSIAELRIEQVANPGFSVVWPAGIRPLSQQQS